MADPVRPAWLLPDRGEEGRPITATEEKAHRAVVARRERAMLLLAAASLTAGALTLVLGRPDQVAWSATWLVAWLVCFSVAHFTLSRWLPERDPLLLPVVALLTGFGLMLLQRLAVNFLLRQVTWLAVSTAALLAIVRFSRDLRWLRRFRYTWLFSGLLLLAATLVFGVNPSGYGPRLWLNVLGVYFQPSELVKLLLVVYLASYLAERRGLLVSEAQTIGRWRLPPLAYVGPLLVMFGLAVVLLAWQQDLGPAMLFFFTFLTMLYLATGQWGYVASGVLLFCLVGLLGYCLSSRIALRIDAWINPWPDAADRAFQIVQSLLAFSAGGLFGQGLGMGSPTYIPAVHTDFVFAAIAEELGLTGALAVVGLYAALLVRGFRVAASTPRLFERFLVAGLTAGLVIQAWVIMAGNAKLTPIAGVTLPFVSYGGSSLLISFVALGFLLRVSADASLVPGAPRLAPAIRCPLLRVAFTLCLSLAVLAATCGYWAVVRAGWLRGREDNPRRVLYEQRILRGRIIDRDGAVLADVQVGDDGEVTRYYLLPEAVPVLGYASLRYGTGGIEAAFDEELRGEAGRSLEQVLRDELLHRPPNGRDVRLTLDAALQAQAQEGLAGQTGAAVLIDVVTGEVLAMASSPTFDPARLDEDWEALRTDPQAPLVNRATQGLYQPGAVLETVILAEALGRGLAVPTQAVSDMRGIVRAGGILVLCARPPAGETLADAYRAACPSPFADLGEALGPQGIADAVARWGLDQAPLLELPAEASGGQVGNPRVDAVGQGDLTVSPLQMALLAAALANGGTAPAPRVVLEVEDISGLWTPSEQKGTPHPVVTRAEADALLALWTPFGNDVLGHAGPAIGAAVGPAHRWFIGVGSTPVPRYAVAVLIEQAGQPGAAESLGVRLLRAASALD